VSDDLHLRDADGVRWITIDRPASRNGLTLDTAAALTAAMREASADDSVRVVVLAGAGGAFCSGLDLKAALTSGMTDIGAGLNRFQELGATLRQLRKPTIAAIDGPAAGFGADLALGCDLRFASPRASLGARFVRIGLMPDGGGTFLLPRLVGTQRAFDLLYSGRMVEADEMVRLGIADSLPADGFEAAVQERAAELARGAPLAYAAIKEAVLAGQGDFGAAQRAEGEGQLRLLASQDFGEGVMAFLQKRPPTFHGR
jgi:enoyl-CoA hydratase/carnithine racemase